MKNVNVRCHGTSHVDQDVVRRENQKKNSKWINFFVEVVSSVSYAGETCKIQQNCIPYAACINDTICACMPGFEEKNGACCMYIENKRNCLR